MKRQNLIKKFCEIMHIDYGDIEKYSYISDDTIKVQTDNHRTFIFVYRSDDEWSIHFVKYASKLPVFERSLIHNGKNK